MRPVPARPRGRRRARSGRRRGRQRAGAPQLGLRVLASALGAALAVAVAVLAGALQGQARAQNVQPITPIVTHTLEVKQDGKGVLVTNTPYGYYTGRLFATDTVTELYATRTRVYTYDMIAQSRAGRRFIQCGWIESVVLQRGVPRAPVASPCNQPRARIDRSAFGREFNCAPSACIDGARTYLAPSCDGRAYYNRVALGQAGLQAAGSEPPEGFYDYAGQIDRQRPVYYRYTTVDDRAAVIRTRQYGWVFVRRSCIVGYPQGGTPKPLALALAGPMLLGRVRSLGRQAAAPNV